MVCRKEAVCLQWGLGMFRIDHPGSVSGTRLLDMMRHGPVFTSVITVSSRGSEEKN